MYSKILKIILLMPRRSPERSVLQKHGSTELMTIGRESAVVIGAIVVQSLLMIHNCNSLERLYLYGDIIGQSSNGARTCGGGWFLLVHSIEVRFIFEPTENILIACLGVLRHIV